MAGGHTDRSEGSVFTSLRPLHEWREELEQKRRELVELTAEIEKTAEISRKWHELKEVLTTAQRRLNAINENLKNSELGVVQNELEQAKKELEEVTVEVADKKKRFDEIGIIVKELESRKKNDKGFQEKEKKKLREKLDEIEQRSAKNKDNRESASRNILAKKAEVDELTEQIRLDLENLEAKLVELENKKKDLEDKGKEVEEALKNEKVVRDELDSLKRKVRQQDEEMKKVMKMVDSHKREKLKITSNIENFEKEVQRYVECEKLCKTAALKQKKRCEWIDQEEQHFGKKNTEYDFDGFSEERGQNNIKEISSNLEAMERKINTKASQNFDAVEAKLQDIKVKRGRVQQDRTTLLRTINVLDEKKVEEIEKAYKSVNSDFGNIFSTLLPGAHAQLVPLEGKSVLEGVEVRVSFNGQWKESLQELSGGQRSLVALSLILAMLKFKPAPLYILDEVDAALDLSHTANIGKMIKTHFTNSQFVVVSLKEGMFSNADVLFQTKFVDGTSTVRRTENHQLT
ncbi:unnamed protein product [Caenorhabditis angaria]|uniref:RecF/RecN/SMC N-terminal domain-containing protein n=1 Tax=Caenorhabditis angaria TaxID=860376 RepID=A0A9P1IF45_9PELO|nr:unnamed protein product [Caenorhabditis angaria]